MFNEDKQRAKLEKRLAHIGRPGWKAAQAVRGIGKLAVMLYAFHAGIQTYSLLQSDAYKSRETMAKVGYDVVQELKADSTFHGLVGTYIGAKKIMNPGFEIKVDSLEESILKAHETRDEFIYRVEKIYNPFLRSELP